MLEAFPDETSSMKYKLVTLPKRTSKLPVVAVAQTSITLTYANQEVVVAPYTVNFPNANDIFGYTAILSDSDSCDLIVSSGASGAPSTMLGDSTYGTIAGSVDNPTVPRFISDSEAARSITVIGLEFKLRAKKQLYRDIVSTLTIVGNQTGGSVNIPITVSQELQNTPPAQD